MLKLMGKKIFTILHSKILFNLSCGIHCLPFHLYILNICSYKHVVKWTSFRAAKCNLPILIKYLTFMVCEQGNEFEPWAGQVQALFYGYKGL